MDKGKSSVQRQSLQRPASLCPQVRPLVGHATSGHRLSGALLLHRCIHGSSQFSERLPGGSLAPGSALVAARRGGWGEGGVGSES